LALIFVLSSSAGLHAEEKAKTAGQLIREAKAQIKEVSVQDVKKMMDNKENVVFLDVRDKEEYDKGHLPGAIHMSRGLLDFHIQELIEDRDTKIVTI
jgi:predicted sulfurtransferase